MNETIHKILKKYWGYEQFRPMQEDIINSVLAGNDTLALLPTGGGKSICFQVPCLAIDGLCIVVSPLIALMKDQVENLSAREINAGSIVSGMSKEEIALTINKAIAGEIKFLYVSPERLKTRDFLINIPLMKISLLAIDEAHCISQFGYDFRPPYLEINDFRDLLVDVPVIALTATATIKVVNDIQEKLQFKKRNVFQKSFSRKNLIYNVYEEENKLGHLLRIINTNKGSGIVYVRNRRKTREIADFLQQQGISSSYYNAGLDQRTRADVQADWIAGKTQVIVATNAFGMGIDKPDCRFVVHVDLPDSIEAYFQEAGRAGRDEKHAEATILYHQKDIKDLYDNLDKQFPPVNHIKNIYEALCNYYKIPVGSGFDAKFDFNINDFITSYNLNLTTTFISLTFLEKQGLICISDNFRDMSRVHITASQTDIHKLRINNPYYSQMVEALMRTYSGLFTDYVKINEYVLSKRMRCSTEDIVTSLNNLQKWDYIDYEKANGKPKIIFTSDRRANIIIENKYYKDRKDDAKSRIDAIVHYVSSKARCRSQLLLEYFDENKSSVCNECDYCIAKRSFKSVSERILDVLAVPMQSDDLIKHFSDIPEKIFIDTLRNLRDTKKIKFTSNGFFERVS